jgi:hypothetical protein
MERRGDVPGAFGGAAGKGTGGPVEQTQAKKAEREDEKDAKTHDFVISQFLLVKISGYFNGRCLSTIETCWHS